MRCCEHAELISRQMDEPLPAGEALGLRLHIVICAGCRRFREQVRQIRQLAGGLVGQDLDADESMPKEARARIAAALARRLRRPNA
jgi:hypothetical protein